MPLDDDLTETLRSHWGLDRLVAVSSHRTSAGRTVWRLGSASGEYAVKIDSAPHRSVVGGVAVQAQLAGRLPELVPQPLATTDGEWDATVDGRRITVSAWVSGEPPADTPETWTRIGEVAALLHAAPPVEREFAVPPSSVCAELTGLNRWPADLVGPVSERARHLSDRPAGVLHGQLNLANVIIRADGGIAVLDWDEAGTGPVSVDLGAPLITSFLSEDLVWREAQAAAFYRGYRRIATVPVPTTDDIVAVGLLIGLRSAMFADRDRRWDRVRHALTQEGRLRAIIGG